MAKSLSCASLLLTKNHIKRLLHIFSRKLCYTASEGSSSLFLEFSPACDSKMRDMLKKDMQVHLDFITPEEEKSLMDELEPKFRRTRYQFDHWDDVNYEFSNFY